MSGRRVLFYVQHLLGIGHYRRAATIARAMGEAGIEVTIASGGQPVSEIDLGKARLVQLPPARAADQDFKQLVDEEDRPIDDAWRERRRAALLRAWCESDPDVLLFELFPFGRRQMRFELLPLLEAAAAASRRPAILASVRDILVASRKPGRNEETLQLIDRYFDGVLVHGDADLIPLERTFPEARRIGSKLTYTGYVVDDRGAAGVPGSDGTDEVLVSAGGGAVGQVLLRAAMAARPLTRLKHRRWRILVGVAVPDAAFQSLKEAATDGMIVERARSDFPALLRRCALSVSQAGYNTVMEAISAGCRMVVVPYAAGQETEQTLRAELLAERGLLQIVPEQALSPEAIGAAVERALQAPPPRAAGLRTDGAEVSARLIARWAARRER